MDPLNPFDPLSPLHEHVMGGRPPAVRPAWVWVAVAVAAAVAVGLGGLLLVR